jgi:hypothetical protein
VYAGITEQTSNIFTGKDTGQKVSNLFQSVLIILEGAVLQSYDEAEVYVG